MDRDAGVGTKPDQPDDRGVGGDSPDSPDSGTASLADYDLLCEISRGATGVVYKARQRSLDRIVALKTIRIGPFHTSRDEARFRREAATAARLRHPNLVPVFEFGTDGDVAYYSMELVEGSTFRALVADQPLPAARAAGYVEKVARALHFTHGHGIVHRDLSPANILLDAADEPRVTDFGLARDLFHSSELTESGQFLGTPAYVAPEQARGRRDRVGTSADVYSLGAILYSLITGRPPFVSESIEGVLLQLMHSDPIPPRRLNPVIPRDVETVCLKCLDKEPSRRYASASDLADDLRRIGSGLPVRARPVSGAQRLIRLARRHKGLATVSSLLMFSVLIGLIATTTLWRRERRMGDRLVRTVADLEMQRADVYFDQDMAGRGMAALADILRRDPTNRAAAHRAVSAVMYRDFPRLAARARAGDGAVISMDISPDGRRVITGGSEGWVRVRETEDLREVGSGIRHGGPVLSVQFSPDGTSFVTASLDKTARVHAPDVGAVGRSVPVLTHPAPVRHARFIPDGSGIVTAADDGAARLWSLPDGRLQTVFPGHTDIIETVAVDSTRGRLVTASHDSTARLWDLTHPDADPIVLRHGDKVVHAEFSPDNLRLVTASWDGTAVLRDAATGDPIGSPMRHDGWVVVARFGGAGDRIVTCSNDNAIRVWDGHTALPLSAPVFHRALIIDAVFSPDGSRVAAAAKDWAALVWNLSDPSLPLGSIRLPRPDPGAAGSGSTPWQLRGLDAVRGVTGLRFLPDSRRLAVCGSDGQIDLWDIADGRARPRRLDHSGGVTRVAWHPDGSRLVSVSRDNRVWIWNMTSDIGEPRVLQHQSAVRFADFSPNGAMIVTTTKDGLARVWDVATGRERFDPIRHNRIVWSACFSPDAKRLATASWDGTAGLWNSETGDPLCPPLPHGPAVFTANFSRDGSRLVTGSADGTAVIWSVRPDGLAERVAGPLPHDEAVVWAEFLPDDTAVFTSTMGGATRIWEARTGEPRGQIMLHELNVPRVNVNRSGDRLATASSDHTARIWSAITGNPLTQPLRHRDWVRAAIFGPNDDRLLTVSDDRTARLWDTVAGVAISDPMPHAGSLFAGAFRPDGQAVATASDEGAALIWDTPTVPVPVPDWFPDFLETVGRIRFDDRGLIRRVPSDHGRTVRERIELEPSDPFYRDLLTWFMADRSGRPDSPFLDIP